MKAFCTVFCFFLLLNFVYSVSYDFKTYYLKQKIDHFSYSNLEYFSQRFLVADKFWKPANGTIFFYTGNEGDITWFANNTGFMWELAPAFNALLVFAEHRYYGSSLPYGNLSFKSPTYSGYLTSEQALADFASLIYHLKTTYPGAQESPIIAFGGSYGGMLAAWMRMKYPHLIDGALASSAPVLQFMNLTPCDSFSRIVTNDFAQNGNSCVTSIQKSWKTIRHFGSKTPGLKFLKKHFNLCKEMLHEDIDHFINWIASTWQNLAMTDYPYSTNFLKPLPAYPVTEACKYLNKPADNYTLLLNIYKAVSIFHNYTGDAKCFNISENVGGSLGEQGWDFQSCTEMVMPMCSNGVTDMFESSPWNLSAIEEQCQIKWKVKPDVTKAVIMYGGRDIYSASNIFFSNGKLDPWSAGGILKNVSNSVIAYVIDDAAHHLDLRSSNPKDPLSVKTAREIEVHWIKKWIKNAKMKSY